MANVVVNFTVRGGAAVGSPVVIPVTGSATSGGSQPTVPAFPNSGGPQFMDATFSSDVAAWVDVATSPDPVAGTTRFTVSPGGPVTKRVVPGAKVAVLSASADLGSGAPETVGDGADATQGAKGDTAATDSTSAWSVVALLKGLYAKLGAVVLSAGSAIIGKVGIDQTTRGTTNGVTLVDSAGNEVIDPTLNYALAAYTSSVSLTRPADTTAYAINDVVGPTAAALQFASIGPNGGRALITSAQLEIDVSAVPSGMTSFRLYLYNVTPLSALADNAPWDLPSGDRASFLGYIDLGTPVDLGSTLYVEVNGINKQIKLATADLFAYLVTNSVYTPTSASVAKITLHSVLIG